MSPEPVSRKREYLRMGLETFGESAPQFAKLSKHLMSKYIDGETDEHRLTVHGLSFLRDFDRERNLS